MNRRSVAVFLLCAGCLNLDHLGECLGEAIGGAIGRGIGVQVADALRTPGRADELIAVDGGMVIVSGELDAGGRLILTFDGPLVSESLPTLHGDGGTCDPPRDDAWLVRRDAGSTVGVIGMVMVSSTADGGRLIRCTQLAIEGDAGVSLPDRDFVF